MKIAVIGSGISGMSAAWYLAKQQQHQVVLYESGERLGGHTATVNVEEGERHLAIDTGFIVFNDWTYPEFIRLLDSLGVASQPSRMSFSVSDAQSGLEYAGSSLNALFAQRRNLLSPRFLNLLRGILRFNRQAEQDLINQPLLDEVSLGDYLRIYRYPDSFRDYYLIPMGAAIWSSTDSNMLKMPLRFFVQFFRNHGLLNIRNRPQWRVIQGGSNSYIPALTAPYRDSVRLNSPVTGIRRGTAAGDGVIVHSAAGAETFDQVVFACHSDQTLKILGDQASLAESSILGAIPYENNEVVLHTDISLLPRNRRCWSSWNVALDGSGDERPRLTYNMNILQGLDAENTYCVSLNQTARIEQKHILGLYHYDHPVFDGRSTAAQTRWHEINGIDGLWYCGAYWRNGFHEDGVWSALRVANSIALLEDSTMPESRAVVGRCA